MSEKRKNEGEGNRTAAREYRKKATDFAESRDTTKLGEKAKKDLEGSEGNELREAEEKGKSKASDLTLSQGAGESWEELRRRQRIRHRTIGTRRPNRSHLVDQT